VLVKICGITRQEDAAAAAALGADALGFVFWPASPRFVEPSRARDIIATLPSFVAAVGVFVNQPAAHINAVARLTGLAVIQLHGDEEPGLADQLTRPAVKAVAADDAEGGCVDMWPRRVTMLIDVRDPVRRGGTGRTVDWTAAARLARRRRALLAGGLHPGNVAAAVRQVRPFGIDVSSGVERAPGIKDHERLRELFQAVALVEGDTWHRLTE
jgi:phosphoribosylanthranilate isomerase